MLRRTHRRRIEAARARQRGRRGSRRARGELAQLVHALADLGELGRQQSFFSGGGSLRSWTDSAFLATNHPGEHGLVIAMIQGCSGWEESIGEGLWCANRAAASAARASSIPARCGSSGLVAGAVGARGGGVVVRRRNVAGAADL